MISVDVHCHLTHKYFKGKIDEVIKRAEDSGVKAIIVNGVNHLNNLEVLELAQKYKIIKPALGLYPIDALGIQIDKLDEVGLTKDNLTSVDNTLRFIEEHKKEIVAIGEVGLDFKYLKEHEKLQKENFQKIIDITEKIKKPIIVHSRNAEKEAIEILQSSKIKNIILHCFGGSKKLVRKAADSGFNFTIPSVVKRLKHFEMVIASVNINQLLTETDSPWLTPELGRFSEPKDVIESIKKIAEIKRFDIEETANTVFMNYQRVFL